MIIVQKTGGGDGNRTHVRTNANLWRYMLGPLLYCTVSLRTGFDRTGCLVYMPITKPQKSIGHILSGYYEHTLLIDTLGMQVIIRVAYNKQY